MIINPVKYPGNKAKILKQIIPEIEVGNKNTVIDVFSGSGIVALNTNYEVKVCNDLSIHAIELLKYFYKNSSQIIISNTEKIIKDYNLTYSRNKPKGYYKIIKNEGLSNYNRKGYLKLRKDYNEDKKIEKLFVLMIYGFNHYIRFNSKGEFNVPVGKGDFSDSIYKETLNFVDEIKKHKIIFQNYDFRNKNLYKYENAVFYFDPPYLITNAPYNGGWTLEDESDLLDLLDELNSKGEKFVLSNVFLSNGKTNHQLINWSKKYNVISIERQYRNSNYRKKNLTDTQEVIIKNF